MNKVELAELRWRVAALTSLIDTRNFARIEARKGTAENRDCWIYLYRDTVRRIKIQECAIGRLLPTREYKRVSGKIRP